MRNQIQFDPTSGHPLRAALGDAVGEILCEETRDGVPWVGVLFEGYGEVHLPVHAFRAGYVPEAPKQTLTQRFVGLFKDPQ